MRDWHCCSIQARHRGIVAGAPRQRRDPACGRLLLPRLEGRIAHVALDDHLAEQAREVIIDSGHTVLDERDVLIVDANAGLRGSQESWPMPAWVFTSPTSARTDAVIGTQDVERQERPRHLKPPGGRGHMAPMELADRRHR